MVITLPDEGISGEALRKYVSDTVVPEWNSVKLDLGVLEKWARGKQDIPRTIRNAERKSLLELSRTPWMRLMVSTFAQQLLVDGYRKAGTNENAKAWDTWKRNQMPSQQIALNRSVITYGHSYLKVTEGKSPTGEVMAVMRAKSPVKVFCLYEDVYGDEWPLYVLEKLPDGTYLWWDSDKATGLKNTNGKWDLINTGFTHDYGHPPFVRYVNEIDLDGKCWGDVEPVIEIAARLDKTMFDRLLVQHYNSFKVRWATGLEQPDSDPDIEKTKVRLANEEMLISSKVDAKFGTLDETSMDSFIESYKSDLATFLVSNQLPASLAGQIVNVAADALAQSNQPTVQKLQEKQSMIGQAHDQAMRFVNEIEGRTEESTDFEFGVHWASVEIQSLAQFADAWGKIVETLKVPSWGVWDMIPGVEQSTVEGWKEDYLSNKPFIKYMRETSEGPGMMGGQGGTNSGANLQKVRNDNAQPKPTKSGPRGSSSGGASR